LRRSSRPGALPLPSGAIAAALFPGSTINAIGLATDAIDAKAIAAGPIESTLLAVSGRIAVERHYNHWRRYGDPLAVYASAASGALLNRGRRLGRGRPGLVLEALPQLARSAANQPSS